MNWGAEAATHATLEEAEQIIGVKREEADWGNLRSPAERFIVTNQGKTQKL